MFHLHSNWGKEDTFVLCELPSEDPLLFLMSQLKQRWTAWQHLTHSSFRDIVD